MVNVREMKGWILEGEYLPHNPELDEDYFIQEGVRKATVFICGYCEEGWHLKKEDAEKCCEVEK
jgi:hypothetical protein